MYTLTCFARDDGLDPPRLLAKARRGTLKEVLDDVRKCFTELAGGAREVTATLTLWSASEDDPAEPATT